MDTDKDTIPDNLFYEQIKSLNKSQTPHQLSCALAKLVAKVRETGKKGTLTYELVVEPFKNHDSAVIITDDIKVKLPELPRRFVTAYLTPDGLVSKRDPDQRELSFDSTAAVEAGGIQDSETYNQPKTELAQ